MRHRYNLRTYIKEIKIILKNMENCFWEAHLNRAWKRGIIYAVH
jgi:hypothetical protein